MFRYYKKVRKKPMKNAKNKFNIISMLGDEKIMSKKLLFYPHGAGAQTGY
jgi:hypothetical protein